MRVGGRREGAKERAVVRSAAATVAALSTAIAAAYGTPPPPRLPRRLTDLRWCVMRCGYNRDTTPREGGSARRGSYWAASGANYPPITGRQGISLECAHLGLVAGTCSRYQANIGKLFFLPPDKCSVFVSGMYGVRVRICTAILCVLTPILSLPCSAKRRRVEARKQG